MWTPAKFQVLSTTIGHFNLMILAFFVAED